jgi:hypothetical protein
MRSCHGAQSRPSAVVPRGHGVQRAGSVVTIAHPVKGWASLALRAELPQGTVAVRYRWPEGSLRLDPKPPMRLGGALGGALAVGGFRARR